MSNEQSVYQRGLDGPPLGPNRRGDKRAAVIGAGASGLCSAKYLLQAGFDVTVFEIGSQIGGMLCFNNDSGRSSAYRTLHINTSRGVTRFSDLDFDPETQPFPDHYDMLGYLVRYADHLGLRSASGSTARSNTCGQPSIRRESHRSGRSSWPTGWSNDSTRCCSPPDT